MGGVKRAYEVRGDDTEVTSAGRLRHCGSDARSLYKGLGENGRMK